jgi:hypothetical protein
MLGVLSEVAAALKRGAGLAFFRSVSPYEPAPGAAALLLLIALCITATAGVEAALGGAELKFNAYGLSAALAGWGLFAAFLVMTGMGRPYLVLGRSMADIAALGTLASLPAGGVAIAETMLSPEGAIADDPALVAAWAILLVWAITVLWWAGRILWRGALKVPGLRMIAAVLLPVFLIPYQPLVFGSRTDWSRYDLWYVAAEYWPGEDQQEAADQSNQPPPIDVEAAYYRQPALVEATLGTLAPSRPDQADFYFVGVAPYASQSVFKREAMAVRDIFDERFGTRGRSTVLVNHRDTLAELPLANVANLGAVLDKLGRIMDADKDVLVLFITSHGLEGRISADFPGFSPNDFTPADLAGMLERSGIKDRVVVISACYSGSFIPALADEHTLIMTASSANKTSFGCSDEREWTYFGDALFNRALRTTRSFTDAFAEAKATIEAWEAEQKLTPSEPQISVGRAIAPKLDLLARVLSQTAIPAQPAATYEAALGIK